MRTMHTNRCMRSDRKAAAGKTTNIFRMRIGIYRIAYYDNEVGLILRAEKEMEAPTNSFKVFDLKLLLVRIVWLQAMI